jgi:hypothetical protein
MNACRRRRCFSGSVFVWLGVVVLSASGLKGVVVVLEQVFLVPGCSWVDEKTRNAQHDQS